jgi:hypothetical protein
VTEALQNRVTDAQDGLSGAGWWQPTDDVSEPPSNPFRVYQREGFQGPPLTQPQHRVLSALVSLCPEAGCDVSARAVSELADLRLGSVVVVLRSLEKRRLALVHEGEPQGWAPTMTGRSRVRHFRPAAVERTEP